MNIDRDSYETPPEVFERLDRQFNFGFDVCANDDTAKCLDYWTKKDDALSKNWAKDIGDPLSWKRTIWCNPPYSDIGPWVDKAIEAQANGVCTVMLVMADTSVGWFDRGRERCSEVIFITGGRLSFYLNGVKQSGNNKGSLIFVFDPWKIGHCVTSYMDRSELLGIKK